MAAMPTAPPNDAGIELCYETFGDASGEPMLLVMGLGAQMVVWDDDFVEALVDRGFYVIRYDNRDVGMSTKCEVIAPEEVGVRILSAMGGAKPEAPYLLSDMAADGMSLLDHLGVDSAHIVGASMGGMIVQQMVVDHPQRVRSVTSIMSTTGDPDVGQPEPEAMAMLLQPPPANREQAIEQGVVSSRAISSPAHFDEDKARQRAALTYDRCFHPDGVARQLLAIIASDSRSPGLREVQVPALVIHGDADPLVTPSGGERTAEVIPGAELLVLEGMGHDLPPVYWPQIVEAITALAARSVAAA
jgi:pimeloyl-ACP methyl ester carboxylesterase